MRSLRTAIAVCKLSCIFHFLSFFAFFLVLPVSFRYFVPFFALFCSVVFFLVFWPFAFCGKLRPCTFMVIAEGRKLLRCVFFWFFGLLPFVESYDQYTFMVIAEGRNWFVSFLVFWPSAFCGKLQSCTFVVIAESRKLVKPEIFDIFGLTEKK